MNRKMPKKWLITNDTHCGSLAGLTPEKYLPSLSTEATQIPLWKWWESEIIKCGAFDGHVHVGDAIDGPGRKDTIGHITTNTEKQRHMFYEAMEPVKMKKGAKRYFTYGTPYHTTGSEDWEKQIAMHYHAPIKDVLYLEIEGHLFRFRHHAGRSNTATGQGTQLQKEIIRDFIAAVLEEEAPAEYSFHAHVHYYCTFGNALSTAYSCPCLQVPESVYSRKCMSAYYDMGFLTMNITPEKVDVEKHIMPIKIVRKREYIHG